MRFLVLGQSVGRIEKKTLKKKSLKKSKLTFAYLD